MLTDVFTRISQAADFLPLTAFNFGAEHREALNKAPPNIDCWATTDTWKNGERKGGTGYSAANRSVGTRAAGARFRIWGGDTVKGGEATSLEHHAATEDLLRRFLVVLHREFFGSYTIRTINWLGQDGSALSHFGRSVEVEVEFDVPINEADPAVTTTVITSESHTVEVQPQPTPQPGVQPLVRWSMIDSVGSTQIRDEMNLATLTVRTSGLVPEIISAPSGRLARRFSRLGIDAQQVVPSGAFAQIDRKAYDQLCFGEWTIGGWMRRDPALVPGSAALTRILGTRIGPVVLGPAGSAPGVVRGIDLSWANDTGALIARVQRASTPTTVQSQVATFATTAPLSKWTHVVFRKRNLNAGVNFAVDVAINGHFVETQAPSNGGGNYNPVLIGDVPLPAEQGKATLVLGGSMGFDSASNQILYGIDAAFRDLRIYDRALDAQLLTAWFSPPVI